MDNKPKKRGRPKGSTKKPVDKKVDKKLEALVKQTPKALAYSKTFALINQVERGVLQGQNMQEIKDDLLVKGYKVSTQKCYRMIRIAKTNIAKRFEKDFETDYEWVRENLMDLHNKALLDDDQRLRLMAIDKFMQLAGLNIQRVESISMQITEDKFEEFETMLIR